jgi:RNA 2',3'-cyclic 3'-phosphodiesterase
MAPESDGPRRARLFVALELPEPARESLATWARGMLADDEALRLVAADTLHVTLVFLGGRDERLVDDIAATVRSALDGLSAPELAPRALAGLPARAPRVLAIDLEDRAGRAGALQGAVEEALVAAGVHQAERRAFRPHVTVARVRKGRRAPSGRFPEPPGRPFVATDVVLFRSDLSPAGARYTALARASLPAVARS